MLALPVLLLAAAPVSRAETVTDPSGHFRVTFPIEVDSIKDADGLHESSTTDKSGVTWDFVVSGPPKHEALATLLVGGEFHFASDGLDPGRKLARLAGRYNGEEHSSSRVVSRAFHLGPWRVQVSVSSQKRVDRKQALAFLDSLTAVGDLAQAPSHFCGDGPLWTDDDGTMQATLARRPSGGESRRDFRNYWLSTDLTMCTFESRPLDDSNRGASVEALLEQALGRTPAVRPIAISPSELQLVEDLNGFRVWTRFIRTSHCVFLARVEAPAEDVTDAQLHAFFESFLAPLRKK